MTDEWYTEEFDAPDAAGGMRSGDLYNRTILIRPIERGEDVGKEDGQPYTFWTCQVVILNPAGVESYDDSVRISWKRVQRGLANAQGKWSLVKAVQDGQAWVLDPKAVDPKVKAIVPGLKDEVLSLFPSAEARVTQALAATPADEYDGSPETF